MTGQIELRTKGCWAGLGFLGHPPRLALPQPATASWNGARPVRSLRIRPLCCLSLHLPLTGCRPPLVPRELVSQVSRGVESKSRAVGLASGGNGGGGGGTRSKL